MVSEAVALQPRAHAGYLCGIPWHFVGIRFAFCPMLVPPAPLPQSTRTCQLLSCHCEALRDPLVASGVTEWEWEKDTEFGGNRTGLDWLKIHPALLKLE